MNAETARTISRTGSKIVVTNHPARYFAEKEFDGLAFIACIRLEAEKGNLFFKKVIRKTVEKYHGQEYFSRFEELLKAFLEPAGYKVQVAVEMTKVGRHGDVDLCDFQVEILIDWS